jgi:hypothetical protein
MNTDAEIKSILLDLEIYSLAIARVGSEAVLFDMFQNDFETLMTICMGGE